uniref:superoxide dismutase n=1 Tax=viral metagenome TaxID=1070528 RepID=A0A6C0H6T4_9ZZZZ
MSSAIAVFGEKRIKGVVRFTEKNDGKIRINVKLFGLKKNGEHGFHIHEYGDMSDKCESMCLHFNPYNKKHGCPGKKQRHVGDLGNIITDENGNANYEFEDDVIKLHGKNNIIGRGLIIHRDRDDCGEGDNEQSKITGNAGKRIACAVIGYAKPE